MFGLTLKKSTNKTGLFYKPREAFNEMHRCYTQPTDGPRNMTIFL